MNDISVIIVSWNGREYLRQCLNSIRKTGGNLVGQIIVVDNASTDGSPELVENEYPEVLLIRSAENLGFARANNLGLQKATGQWLALVNSDVIVHEKCFEELVGALERCSEAGLAGPRVFGSDGALQPTCRPFPTFWGTIRRSFALDTLSGTRNPGPTANCAERPLVEAEVVSGCFWMARRAAVQKVGPLDERFFFYAEDLDWCKRFSDAGWKILFVPGATATHFGGGSSANAPLRYSIELLRANLCYWEKYWGMAGRSVFFTLSVAHHTIRLLARGLRVITSGRGGDGEAVYKFERSKTCLRWLLTGRGV